MAEKKTTRPRRRRRSTATLERLEAARERRAEQLERERENERRVDEALGPFAEAATAIEAVERKRDDRLGALESQLERKLAELERQRAAKVEEYDRLKEQVRADADMEIADWRTVMATSVRQIRRAEVSVSATAAMLGISPRAVSALAREGSADDGTPESADTEAASVRNAEAAGAPDAEADAGTDAQPVDTATSPAEAETVAVDPGGGGGEFTAEAQGPSGWPTGVEE
ncbi:hypothetical protein [Amycolatopsis anabasis]|uniref:hypothetical protein n=1 Tax=Amycolatopsis anabasis TaxID=1840409 RepID=UPI00131CE83F|nr:hypothetical protein [Amycolatopsis anabasis]